MLAVFLTPALSLVFGLIVLLGLGFNEVQANIWLTVVALVLAMVALPTIWVTWAFLFEGGFTLRMAGLALSRIRGGKASRIQCAWRALLVWLPVVLVQLIGPLQFVFGHATRDAVMRTQLTCAGLTACLLVLYLILALLMPRRSLHDRLAGTCLVPR
jgi:hypothetical protein